MPHTYTYPEYRHLWYVRYTYATLKNIFGPFVRLIWIKKVSGIEHLPRTGPAIIAFNHQSYFDFLCFTAICPRPVHFLSAEKFFSHVIWKHFMNLTGQIKVHRKEHDKHILHATVHDHLKNGKIIGIFPEGTRAPDPIEMLHAFTGIARYAIDGQVPVIPVGIKGAHEVMSRYDKFPKFRKTILFHIGVPIHFTEHYGKILTEKDYRDATDKIMLEVSKLSGKRYSHVGKMGRDATTAV
ncbi:MAG: lysophospholipid acyltransferase family protein [Minisyncoccota bacterium]